MKIVVYKNKRCHKTPFDFWLAVLPISWDVSNHLIIFRIDYPWMTCEQVRVIVSTAASDEEASIGGSSHFDG